MGIKRGEVEGGKGGGNKRVEVRGDGAIFQGTPGKKAIVKF